MKVNEGDLKRIIVEEISRAISNRESKLLKEEEEEQPKKKVSAKKKEEPHRSAFILQDQYHDFIMNACHLLAWKGITMDIDLKSVKYRVAFNAVNSYHKEKNEAIKDYGDNKESVQAVKDKYMQRFPGLVESEAKGYEMLQKFMQDGYYFISTFIGGKTNSSKQMEKAAGLELFGVHTSGLREFLIKNGAVFCVRDFFKWVDLGCPGLAKKGERLKGTDKHLIRGKEEFKGIRNKGDDESDIDMYNKHNEEPEFEDEEVSDIEQILNGLVNDVVSTINTYKTEEMTPDEQKVLMDAIKENVMTCSEENELSANLLMYYIKAMLGALPGISADSIKERIEMEYENVRRTKAAFDRLKTKTGENGGRLA